MGLLTVFISFNTLVFFGYLTFCCTWPIYWWRFHCHEHILPCICPVRGLFTLGSIPIVFLEVRELLFRYSCGILLRFTLLFIWLTSCCLFSQSCTQFTTFLTGVNISCWNTNWAWHSPKSHVVCTLEREGCRAEDLFPWVLVIEFTLSIFIVP